MDAFKDPYNGCHTVVSVLRTSVGDELTDLYYGCTTDDYILRTDIRDGLTDALQMSLHYRLILGMFLQLRITDL